MIAINLFPHYEVRHIAEGIGADTEKWKDRLNDLQEEFTVELEPGNFGIKVTGKFVISDVEIWWK